MTQEAWLTPENIERLFEGANHWSVRYKKLFEFADTIAPLPDDIHPITIEGCSAPVELLIEHDNDRYRFRAYSDSKLIRGLISLLIAHLNNHTKEEIAEFDIEALFRSLDFGKYVNTSRVNGLMKVRANILKIIDARWS